MIDWLESILRPIVEGYPWAAFLVIWLIWVGSTVWEHQGHRDRQATGGGLGFLFCVLAFAVSTIEALGIFTRLLLAGAVLIIGLFFIAHVLWDEPSKK